MGARISDCESERTQTEQRMEFNGRESSKANERAGEANGSSSEIEPECVEIDEVEKSKIGIMRALVEAQDPTSKVFPKDPFHLFFSLLLFIILGWNQRFEFASALFDCSK